MFKLHSYPRRKPRTKICERCSNKYETTGKNSLRCPPCRKIVNAERSKERHRQRRAAGIEPHYRDRHKPKCTYRKVSSYRPSHKHYEDIIKITNVEKHQGAEPTGWAWLEIEALERALLGDGVLKLDYDDEDGGGGGGAFPLQPNEPRSHK